MKSASDLVKNLGQKVKQKEQEVKAYKEWPNCSAPGCPLQTTIKADNCTCLYHFRTHGREAETITESIKQNLNLYRRYGEMIRWNVRTWKEKAPQIMGWPVLPATEEEMNLPTLYLNRFKKYMDGKIKQDAEAIYRGDM